MLPSAPPAKRSAAAANAAPRQHQHLRAQRRQHGQLERTSSARNRRVFFLASAASAQNRTKTKQHRVSCSMVDKMDVLDSAQRITSPRSQHTASSTGDSLSSASDQPCALCVPPSQHPLARVSPRVRADVFALPPFPAARLGAPPLTLYGIYGSGCSHERRTRVFTRAPHGGTTNDARD